MSRERVGYRRPPREHQFKPGQSGNPYGRPRKPVEVANPGAGDSELDAILRRVLNQKMSVKTASGIQEMSRLEAIINSLHRSAIGGSVFAQREALAMAQELETREALRREAEADLDRRVFERICAWKRERVAVWRDALARGEEPEQPWPHPDDVLVDHNSQKWTVRGPWRERDVPNFEHIRAERDWNIAALVNLDPKAANTAAYRFSFTTHNFARTMLDTLLPLRWQLDEAAFKGRYFNLAILTDKQRARELERLDQLRQRLMPIRSKAEERETEREVNRLMRPLLKHFGVRTAKQLEQLAS